MIAVAAVDSNWGIGNKGGLLERIPEDMRFLKKITSGKVVVMGRKTLQSLPGQKPLRNRRNIILSAKGRFDADGLVVCRTPEELFHILSRYPPDDIFILGGESVYNLLLPYCNEAFITMIHRPYEADRHFPNLDDVAAWSVAWVSETMNFGDISYNRVKYRNDIPQVYAESRTNKG